MGGTGYALTFGSVLLLGGRAGDLLGRRRLLVIGVAVFALASLTSGLAQSSLMLIASRVVQGVGGALVSPTALSLLTVHSPEGPARNRALGLWSAAAVGGASAGVVLGGILPQYVDWRAIFLINIPIAALLLFFIPRTVEEDHASAGARLDVAGAALITAAIPALIFAVSGGDNHGLTSAETAAAGVGFIALSAAFVFVEQHSAHPLVRVHILASATRRAGDGSMLLMGAIVISYEYFASLYLQRVLRLEPVVAGL